MAIYYLCPDFSQPSGGVKRIYDHVAILRAHGREAHVVHREAGFRLDWFDTDIEPLSMEAGVRVGREDWIMAPESLAHLLPSLPKCNHALLVLGPFYLFQMKILPQVLELCRTAPLATNSPCTASFLTWLVPVARPFLVETGVDPRLFHPHDQPTARDSGAPVRIAYSRRKDTTSERAIALARQHLGLQAAMLEVVPLDDLPLADYAAVLRRTDIWLTTALVQGFPRSTLEAMACGCCCVGYQGLGGGDILEPGVNGAVAPGGDVFALTRLLAECIQGVRTGDIRVRQWMDGALATASGHTPEYEEHSVLALWRALENGEGGPA